MKSAAALRSTSQLRDGSERKRSSLTRYGRAFGARRHEPEDDRSVTRNAKEWVYNPSQKGRSFLMSEDALRGLYWAGVIVLALALWVIWYMLVKM